MQIDIQPHIDVVMELFTTSIEGLPDAIDGPDIYEPDPDAIIEAAERASEAINAAVTAGYTELVEGATDDVSTAILPASMAVTGLLIRKALREAAHRVQVASTARQIFDDQRESAIEKAVELSINAAEAVIEGEFSASVAEFDNVTAQENGFSYYEYSTSNDGAVRPEHKGREGKLFRYGAARVPDDVPGLAHRCRCVAFPLSDEEAIERSGDFYYPEDAPQINMKKPARISLTFPGVKKHQANVTIEGMVGDWTEYNDFQSFKQRVNSEIGGDASREIQLDITSHGGYADDALACYSWLRALPNRVVSNIYGYAGSAATAFIAASDHVTADRADQVLIHKSWTFSMGNADDMRETAKELDATDNSLVIAYQQKTGKSRKEILKLMEQDRYISAEDALDFGLIDEIRGESPVTIPIETGGYMPTQEEYDQLLGEFNALKAEKKTAEAEVTELKGTVSEMQVQMSVLSKKAEQVDNIDELVEQRINEQAQAKAAVSAQRERLEAMGFKAEGDTVAAMNRSAVLAMGLDGADKFTNEQATIAIDLHEKMNVNSAVGGDGGMGRQFMGQSQDKPETRAQRAARLHKEAQNG